MRRIPLLPLATLPLAIAIINFSSASAEEVEITGTLQVQISCGQTHHEELAMVKEPGEDKFSGKTHALQVDRDALKGVKIGETITVKGKKHKATTKKMTKGQVRKAMVDFIKKGKGMPLHGEGMEEIISKIQVNKPAPGAGGEHDHGELELKAVEDDDEVVEVHIMEHIEVADIVSKK